MCEKCVIFDGNEKVKLVSPTVTINLTNEEVEHLDDEKLLRQVEHSTKSPPLIYKENNNVLLPMLKTKLNPC